MNFNDLTEKQRISFVVVAAILLTTIIFASYQLLKTDYVVLYQDDNLANVALITEQLQEDTIDFKLAEFGRTVLVPENKLNSLKVKLAQTSLSASTSPGFELFDNVDYSMTEHAQKITFQRALQGELEQTLKNYQAIADARVHITMPEKRLFASVKGKVKASVSLWLVDGSVFAQDQVKGVQELVASSVEELMANNVIILDASGRTMSLASNENSVSSLFSNKNENLENLLTDKAVNLLSLYFNASELAVSVTVAVDHTKEKLLRRAILLNDDNQGFITRKKESSTIGNADSKENAKKNNQIEVEYEHGIETAERVTLPGAITKVSVAVAISSDIDDIMVNKINNLIFAGLGLNISRGDQLSVETFPIIKNNYLEPQTVKSNQKDELSPQKIIQSSFFEQQVFYYGLAFVLLISLLVAGFSLKRKRLTYQETQALQLKFNQWLTVKDVVTHVK